MFASDHYLPCVPDLGLFLLHQAAGEYELARSLFVLPRSDPRVDLRKKVSR